ncbi:helix-turn-helix domain containing protein [Neorhizobium sp. T786]|uniref:helix-turn-helix domain containing protein n=1 Tax=Pseudorhizobium xiangyangii TaxID=2883104 RepID=UPI001D000826|nr:helix-turn-helix domain containing protein [Neorhizobium xiangyangii]MCB5201682.1 helix-turn-helix domain containing protein [Neorhizobium xiangyangii]
MADITPLDRITEILASGSRSELARLLDVHRSTVSGWDNPERRAKGMRGTIPEKYVRAVVRIAAAKGVPVAIQDLFPEPKKS